MQLIDTHSHIFLEEFNQDRNEVVQRAIDNQVSKIVLPNVDLETIQPLTELCKAYPNHCFPAMGLHPGSVAENFEKDLETTKNELYANKYIAVGEIGIDLYWDKTFKEQQIKAFDIQIKWAKELNLPIIIHLRNSYDEVVEVVKQNLDKKLRGIFHCFSGTVKEGEEIIDMGFYLGIGGVVTFKNSGLDKVVAQLPIEKMVLETDSPYLTPSPNRGKRNESSNVYHIAEKIAQIKNMQFEEVGLITTSNANKIFKF